MTLEREVRIDGLPQFEGGNQRTAEANAKKWLHFNFDSHGLERVLLVNPKGFAFLLFKDAAAANAAITSDDEVCDITWEDKHIEVTVKRRREYKRKASASSPTAAPAATTGDPNMSSKGQQPPKPADKPIKDKSDNEVQADAKAKVDTEKPETTKAKEFKFGDRSTWTREGIAAWALKEGFELTLEALILKFGGEMAGAIWSFVTGKDSSKLSQKVGDAIHGHLFGDSPRDEFAKYIVAELDEPQREKLAKLLASKRLFKTGQIDKLYENTVAMFEKNDPADPNKKVLDQKGIEAAQKIYKAALNKATPKEQIAGLVSLYMPHREMPMGKLGHALGYAKTAAKSFDKAVGRSEIEETTAEFRANAESASQRRRARKW